MKSLWVKKYMDEKSVGEMFVGKRSVGDKSKSVGEK